MSKKTNNYPDDSQIKAWKKKYNEVYQIDIDDLKCWLRYPDLKIFKHAFASLQVSEIDFQNALVNNCWLAGDKAIRENEDYFNALCDQVDILIDIPEYQIENNGDTFIVKIQGYQCQLNKPKREDIRIAQMKNFRNQPFETNIALLERIWVSGDDQIKQKENCYIALLQAVSELETDKIATVKKL